ncbi:hypothetical protein ACQPZ2_00635 [Nocardia pseudovaccinii]|uniref:hypothetical protein n=1 Tax=Nocardia pseudovaccinii TaxID=189540 RepID=UPI003D93CEC8
MIRRVPLSVPSTRPKVSTASCQSASKLNEATGEWEADNRLISAQMSPRDLMTPPCIQRVDAFVELYVQRTGKDRAPVDRELNTLYQAAWTHRETVRKQAVEEAVKSGRRAPGHEQLHEQEQTIAVLRDQLQDKENELARVRDKIRELRADRQAQIERARTLETEVTDLRAQLDAATDELGGVRNDLNNWKQELAHFEKKLLRTEFERDQQEGRIADLEAGTADTHDTVRQDIATDSSIVRANIADIDRGLRLGAEPSTESIREYRQMAVSLMIFSGLLAARLL